MNSEYLYFRQEKDRTCCLKEDGSFVFLEGKPVRILNEMCLACGSTLQGRTDAVRILLGIRQKPPVLISERTAEIWFGTTGMNSEDCEWLSWQKILHIAKNGSISTVTFMNGISISVSADVRTLRLQAERCRQILQIILKNT
ncbi:MAG: competence protein ComK [Solobacterium sp.]|nr:competence protein ComK [Solobacterium sp.]